MLFACVYVPNFVAQAALRNDPEVASSPFVVVDGVPPQVRVIALNARAKRAGLWVGMTEADAEAQSGVRIRERSLNLERAAHAALVDCLARFSPWCEEVADDLCVLDISGLSKLLGTPGQIARSMREEARRLPLYVKVGVARNIDSAIHAARVTKNVSLLPSGREAELLKSAPLDILAPAPEILETLHRWGIRTFGQLAALPHLALSQRLGQEGLRLQRLAQGLSTRILVPTPASAVFEEEMSFDQAVEDLESLAFIFHRLLAQLTLRLSNRSLAIDELHLELSLDLAADGIKATEKLFSRTLKLPVPTVDLQFLLKLLQLDLEAHQPGAPVAKLVLRVEPAKPSQVQEGMFVPKRPEPQKIELTVARIRNIVGEDRVGSPELIEQHVQVPFRMSRFAPGMARMESSVVPVNRTAVRIFRPSLPADVEKNRGAPRRIRFQGKSYRVLQASGPWRRSGEWWTTEHWGRDEWDLVLDVGAESGRLVVRIYRDLVTGRWYVDGEYD